MRALSLFTGYGGIDLALSEYITEIVAYVEIEEYAQKIISYRMADGTIKRAPILADVKNVRCYTGACDIIYGGFPCQDISIAGNGKGLAGERSGLFYEIVRLTKEARPSFVFLENVPAIRTRGLEQVIKEFTEMGYDCRWTMLSASSVGAPHKRERWFLLAYANSTEIRQTKEQEQKCEQSILNRISMENGTNTNNNSESKVIRQSIKRNKNTKPLWVMESDNWDDNASFFLRMGDGDSFRSHRIKALGNGVVPLQVKTAFEKLIGVKYERN